MFSTCSYSSLFSSGKEFKIGSSLDDSSVIKLNKYFGLFKNLFIDEFGEISYTNAGSFFIKTKTNVPISCQSNKLTKKQNEKLFEKVSELLSKGKNNLR